MNPASQSAPVEPHVGCRQATSSAANDTVHTATTATQPTKIYFKMTNAFAAGGALAGPAAAAVVVTGRKGHHRDGAGGLGRLR